MYMYTLVSFVYRQISILFRMLQLARLKPGSSEMKKIIDLLLQSIFQFVTFYLVFVTANVEFFGTKLADIPMDQQWAQGIPGDGYFTKQPNAILALSDSAKITLGTLSSIWVNEQAVLLMNDEALLSSESWSSMHIYGHVNLGKRTWFIGGRYAHFATYSNRTVSFGDYCQIKIGYWSSVYILDNLLVGSNSDLQFSESSRVRITSCGHPACVIGDGSRWYVAQSASMEIGGSIILLNAANVTIENFSRFIMESNTSLAAALPKPSIHLGEQATLLVRRGTHCLLLDDIIIPAQTQWTLTQSIVDDRMKCFTTRHKMHKLLKVHLTK